MDADSQREENTERSEESLGTSPALVNEQGVINRGDQVSLRRSFSSTRIALSGAHTQAIIQRIVNRAEKPVIWRPSVGKLSPETVFRFSNDILGRYPDLSRKYAVETPQTEEGSTDDMPLAQPMNSTASSPRKVRRTASSEPEIPLELLRVPRSPVEPEPAPSQPRQVIHAPGSVQRKPGVRPVSRIEEVTPGSKPKETPAFQEKREHLVGQIDERPPEPADPALLWSKQEESPGDQAQTQPIQTTFDPSHPKINDIAEEAIPSDRPKNLKIDSAQIPTFEPRRPRPIQRKPAQALDQTVKESKEYKDSIEDPGLSRNLEQVQKKTSESIPVEPPGSTGETGIPAFSSPERVRDILEEDKSSSGDEKAEQTPVSGDLHLVSPVRSSLSSSEQGGPGGTAQPPAPERQPEIRTTIHLPEAESSQAAQEEVQTLREPGFEASIPADTDKGQANLDTSLQELQEAIEPLASSIQRKYQVETPHDELEEPPGVQPFEPHARESHQILREKDKYPQPSLSERKPAEPVQRSTGSGSQTPAAAALSAQDTQNSPGQPEVSSRSEELRSAEITAGTKTEIEGKQSFFDGKAQDELPIQRTTDSASPPQPQTLKKEFLLRQGSDDQEPFQSAIQDRPFPEPGDSLRHFEEPEGQHIQLAREEGAAEHAAPREDHPLAEDTGGKRVVKALDEGMPSSGQPVIHKSEDDTFPAVRHPEPTVQQFLEPDGTSEPPQTGSSAITELRRQPDPEKSKQPVPKLREEAPHKAAGQVSFLGTPVDAVQRMSEDINLSREPEAPEMDVGFSERGDIDSASRAVQPSAVKDEPGLRHRPQGTDRENVHGPAEKTRIDRKPQPQHSSAQGTVQRSSEVSARGSETPKHEPAVLHEPVQDEGIVRDTVGEPPRETDKGSRDTTIQESGQGSVGEISQKSTGGAEQPQATGLLFEMHPTTIESPDITHPPGEKPAHEGTGERSAAHQILQRSTIVKAGSRKSTPEGTVPAIEARESTSQTAAPESRQARQAPEVTAPESGPAETLYRIQRVTEGRPEQAASLDGYAKDDAADNIRLSETGADTDVPHGPSGSILPFKVLQRKLGLADDLIKRSENRTRLPLLSHINTRQLFDETGARIQEQFPIQRKPGRRTDDLPLRSLKPDIAASALPESIHDASPHGTSKSFASTQPANPLNYPIETRQQAGIIQRLPLAPLPVARAQPEGFVQRDFTPADTIETTPSKSEETDIDLDDLARKVYPLVKRLLVIERERYAGR